MKELLEQKRKLNEQLRWAEMEIRTLKKSCIEIRFKLAKLREQLTKE